MVLDRQPREGLARVLAHVFCFPLAALTSGQKKPLLCSVLCFGRDLRVHNVLCTSLIKMSEKVDPRIQKLAVEDPVALFLMLAEMREKGLDPITEGVLPGNPVTKTVKNADRWARQQIDNAVAAGSDWLDGVKNPSRNPIESAIAAKEKWQDRLQAAIKDGKWEKNLAKSSLAEIIEVAGKVGTGAYTTGVSARETKIKKRVAELQPLVQSVSNTIQAMPDKTDADREKRLLNARKLMLEVGKKRAGA